MSNFFRQTQRRMYPGKQWMSMLVVSAFIGTVHAISKNASMPSEPLEPVAPTAPMACEDARLKCAYRTGCGRALQMYLTNCGAVFQGEINSCPEACQHALIALTSTVEGKDLMNCECAKDDRMCLHSKQRIEICRSSVTTYLNRTRISCRLATWICEADTLCSTALYYYHGYCRSMFLGKKCSYRCRNSIDILMRQENAERLGTCVCDGREDYDCKAIHRNMDLLCFGRIPHEYHEVYPDGDDPGETNEVSGSRDKAPFLSQTSLILSFVLLLSMSQD